MGFLVLVPAVEVQALAVLLRRGRGGFACLWFRAFSAGYIALLRLAGQFFLFFLFLGQILLTLFVLVVWFGQFLSFAAA